jgi:hypothetical protein
MAQIAFLQIRVVEGEGTVHVAGARAAGPLTVEVTDEGSRPVSGAAVSFHLPESGPGGSFRNGLRTVVAVSDARGRATARGLQLNREAGTFQIRIIVAKDQVRAGTVSFQYVADARTQPRRVRAARRKWIAMLLAAAGGVAAAALAAGSDAAVPQEPARPPVSIGAPSITIGRP